MCVTSLIVLNTRDFTAALQVYMCNGVPPRCLMRMLRQEYLRFSGISSDPFVSEMPLRTSHIIPHCLFHVHIKSHSLQEGRVNNGIL